jgi:hypothetical protein
VFYRGGNLRPLRRASNGRRAACINEPDHERVIQALQTNPRFRAARTRRECGPITDPQLRADCLASFERYEPFIGSGTAPRRYRTAPGAGY